MMIIKYKDNKSAAYSLGNSCFWHAGKDLYFRQSYNDTIYQVSVVKELQPVRVLDLGVHGWPYDDAANRGPRHNQSDKVHGK